jgi:hypothetical protein
MFLFLYRKAALTVCAAWLIKILQGFEKLRLREQLAQLGCA